MPIDKIDLKKRYQIQLPSLMSALITLLIGIIVGYLGPFGSYEMPLSSRLLYWVTLIAAGHIIYSQTNNLCHWYFETKINNTVLRFLLPSFFAAIILSFFVEYISHLFFDLAVAFPQNFLFYFPKVFILGLVLNLIGLLLEKIQGLHQVNQTNDHIQNQDINKNQDPLLTRFYNRMPKNLGTDLICFSMEDHYLHVHTEIGSHMMLLRMKDALVELNSYNGLQVHRSWWVANDAIIDVKKEARKATLIMKNNIEVPVSQKYLSHIRDAGII